MWTKENIRPVWAEVNLDNLGFNIKEFRKKIGEKTLFNGVVKANAYGHGSVPISKFLIENGVDYLSVATLTEAMELRNGKINAPILVLGHIQEEAQEFVVEYNVIETIYNYKTAKALNDVSKKHGKISKIHIKVDTGMGRLGFQVKDEDVEEVVKIANLSNIEIEGIYTHFARSDESDKTFTNKQHTKFMNMVDRLRKKGIDIPIKHVSNSAAIIDCDDYNLDMVRAGVSLYGYYPSTEVNMDNLKLKPCITLKTRLSHIKKVDKGVGISYGHISTTERESIIGTIPIGYADGYSRIYSNKGRVYINNQTAPLIGRICMDQTMVDITDVKDVKLGDEVILFGYGNKDIPTAEELASWGSTINYEVLTNISKRIPRVYMKDQQVYEILDYITV